MEQHPIPQNISSYQFRLVGDMTLKQFFQLAGGVVIALIIYSLPLISFIKWPLIFFFTLFGIALAFLPFQERPLEQWIIAFFRSVYSPTVFRWKSGVKEEYFRSEAAPTPVPVAPAPTSKTQPANIPFVNALEETEGKFLGKLADLFNSSSVPTPKPAFAGITPTGVTVPSPSPMQSVAPIPQTAGVPIDMNPLGTPSYQPEVAPVSATVPEPKGDVTIPQTGFVSVPKMVVEEAAPGPVTPSAPLTTTAVSQTLTGETPTASQAAQFSTDAAPPSLPTITNTVSGQVMDPEGKIIEGAILEIRDSEGRPVRALRSNKVGHFLTVTPLLNGGYELITEKDGFMFEPYVLNISGGIIPPIAVRAKSRSVSTQVVS